MGDSVSSAQFGSITLNSKLPVTDFEKRTDIIDDEILTFTQDNYGSLISELGLDGNNMTVADLADALNKNENASLADEISSLQSALSDATYELTKTYYTDENITQADFNDERETAISYFGLFNKDGDKAVELQDFVLEAIEEFGLSEDDAIELVDTVDEELLASSSTSDNKTDESGSAIGKLSSHEIYTMSGSKAEFIKKCGDYGISKSAALAYWEEETAEV